MKSNVGSYLTVNSKMFDRLELFYTKYSDTN